MDFDMVFLLTTLTLLVIGTIMIYSSSYFLSKEMSGNGMALTMKHIVHVILGTLIMLGVMSIDYRRLSSKFFVFAGLLCGIASLVLCFVPGIGVTGGHANRWVRIMSFHFQSSELVKIMLVVYLAYFFSKKNMDINNFATGILPVLIVVCSTALLIFIEPDFGTAATIGIWSVMILFAAGMRWKHLLLLILAGIPTSALMMIMEPYRLARLSAFLDPWKDMHKTGYQIIQSMVAYSNGGLTGSGLGEGTQKLFFLPAPHTDFILSVTGEELGFIGISLIIGLFGIWIWRGLSIALATNDSFGYYLVVSSVCLVGLQAVINMGVSMSMLPTTGIALPFFSYGGSTLISTMIISGFILSVSRRSRV